MSVLLSIRAAVLLQWPTMNVQFLARVSNAADVLAVDGSSGWYSLSC
jgi:hypothetical protein